MQKPKILYAIPGFALEQVTKKKPEKHPSKSVGAHENDCYDTIFLKVHDVDVCKVAINGWPVIPKPFRIETLGCLSIMLQEAIRRGDESPHA
ncbi:MAG: hypothetical protein ACWGOL_10980 [Desulfuromonadales bacterium]